MLLLSVGIIILASSGSKMENFLLDSPYPPSPASISMKLFSMMAMTEFAPSIWRTKGYPNLVFPGTWGKTRSGSQQQSNGPADTSMTNQPHCRQDACQCRQTSCARCLHVQTRSTSLGDPPDWKCPSPQALKASSMKPHSLSIWDCSPLWNWNPIFSEGFSNTGGCMDVPLIK